MGRSVLSVTSSASTLRAYGHCHAARNDSIQVMLINTGSASESVVLRLPSAAGGAPPILPGYAYVLSEGRASSQLEWAGKLVAMVPRSNTTFSSVDTCNVFHDRCRPDLPGTPINVVGSAAEGFRFTMRPASIYFVSAAGSGLAGC